MRNLLWGIILILIGVLLLLDNMDVMDFGHAVRTYWPVLLIIWGISVLTKKKVHKETVNFSDISAKVEGELIHKSSVFGDVELGIVSQNFKGGSVSTVFGDCEVDLSKAVIADGEHWLKLHGVFGSCRVLLPKDAAVSVSSNVVMGDVKVADEKSEGFFPQAHYVSPGYDTAPKKLKIIASQVFGDIRIH